MRDNTLNQLIQQVPTNSSSRPQFYPNTKCFPKQNQTRFEDLRAFSVYFFLVAGVKPRPPFSCLDKVYFQDI